MDLTPSVSRLDNLCNLFDTAARHAAARGWPDPLARAASHLARQLEEIAGTLDTAADPAAARVALSDARSALAPAFAAFGRAVAENLAAGSRLKRDYNKKG
ncbi:MAG: hypothetical protein KGJ66_04260 [Alphaproteobacteria bacterium]|nr:hypothetical protein [Alphaproteobacteria bacterium]